MPEAGLPPDHKATHQDGGADEISIADLAGESVNLAAHKLVLDAHTRNLHEIVRTGTYVFPYYSEDTTVNLVAGTFLAAPFSVPRAMTFDRIGIYVATADVSGTPDKTAYLGIYNDGTNLYPGTLVKDAGTVLVNATGIVAATLSPSVSLDKGLYWVALVSNGTPTLRAAYLGAPLIGLYSTWQIAQGAWKIASSYGALPATFPASGATHQDAPLIAMRVETLD